MTRSRNCDVDVELQFVCDAAVDAKRVCRLAVQVVVTLVPEKEGDHDSDDERPDAASRSPFAIRCVRLVVAWSAVRCVQGFERTVSSCDSSSLS